MDIVDAYINVPYTDTQIYLIQFGNNQLGRLCTKEELVKEWNSAIHLSKSISYGDVTLLCKNKVIRSIWNTELPILQKKHNDNTRYGNFECVYNKYKL